MAVASTVATKVVQSFATNEKGRKVLIWTLTIILSVPILILSSPFAIFYATTTKSGENIQDLSFDLYSQFVETARLEALDNSYDEVRLVVNGVVDGEIINNTNDVMCIFATKDYETDRADEVISLDESDVAEYGSLFYEMNTISINIIEEIRTRIITDSKGNEIEEEYTSYIKVITIYNYTALQYAEEVDFNYRQLQILNELLAVGNSTEIVPSYSGDFVGGELGWVVPGYYNISSGYIHRINPVTGKAENHKGIDIPATRGAIVASAEAGNVTSARWSSSYGYVVEIDHGNGLSTLYAHNSSLVVKAGQKVEKGQPIAKVGSTGQSTGNHCHFEVRINGQHTNPLPYLGMSK